MTRFARTIMMLALSAVIVAALSNNRAGNLAAAARQSSKRADPPVTITEDAANFMLANSIVTARVSKRSGDLVSLRYKDLELLGAGSGHPDGYWSHAASGPNVVTAITINPSANAGQRGEVSIKAFSQGNPLGNGPGGSAIADIEIRYTLGRGEPGLYTYSIFEHKPEYPATSIGEARFA